MFSIGKNRILNPLRILRRILGLRESPEYLYRPFDVVPKQTTCEMKTLSNTSLHSAIIS